MTEPRVRYIAATLTAVIGILLFLFVGGLYLSLLLPNMLAGTGTPPAELFLFMAAFFLVGALVVASAFRKLAFHLLSAAEVVLLVIVGLLLFGFGPYSALGLILLIPQIFYYVVRIVGAKLENNVHDNGVAMAPSDQMM